MRPIRYVAVQQAAESGRAFRVAHAIAAGDTPGRHSGLPDNLPLAAARLEFAPFGDVPGADRLAGHGVAEPEQEWDQEWLSGKERS